MVGRKKPSQKKNTLTLSKTTKTSTKQKKPKQNAKQKEKRLFRFATEKWFQPPKKTRMKKMDSELKVNEKDNGWR